MECLVGTAVVGQASVAVNVSVERSPRRLRRRVVPLPPSEPSSIAGNVGVASPPRRLRRPAAYAAAWKR